MSITFITAFARTDLRLAVMGVVLLAVSVLAPAAAAQDQPQAAPTLADAISSATPGEAAVFRYNNRPITTLRASVFSRPPAERAARAVQFLDGLVNSGTVDTVRTRPLQGGIVLSVGVRDVIAIVPLDVDLLAGETLESKAAAAAANLQQAVDEAVELRTPRRILVSVGSAALGTLVTVFLLWLGVRFYRSVVSRLLTIAERRLGRISGDALVRVSRAPEMLRLAVRAVFALAGIFLLYSWLTFVLRRFPYTRPWGESLRTFVFDRIGDLGLGMAAAIPDLFTVLLILLIVRVLVRVANAIFEAVEQGRIELPYVYPETAQPTRRLVTVVLWLLGLVLAYPYLPGSGSEAFKGVSVFVGLVISLGSSGIVNQMMSGVTITYSRAVRVGDFVRIGDVDGTVTQLGPLAIKVKTPRGEEVTIPNAVVMSQVTTNYSRFADTEGVFVPTSLTIGYDAPWRQVHSLLLLAAERTAGVRKSPKPVVRQTALQDFYVQYTLLVCLEKPHLRGPILDALHANIQDAFNEYGVQIMSPNYETDPHAPKIVPPEQWFAAPAKRPAAGEPV